MIDFHSHLDLYPDPFGVAKECIRRQMTVLSVTNAPSAWQGTLKLADKGGKVFTALGLHPQIANQRASELGLFDQLVPKVKWVGEIGLDGGPEFRTHWDTQVRVFEHILLTCQMRGGRVMSIHSRHATREVLDRLERWPDSGVPILHWFSGTVHELERAKELGCWFTVGPAMLCSAKGKALLAKMPLARVLTETDGPFARLDSATLMPWDCQRAVFDISATWRLSLPDVESLLNQNLGRLLEFSRSGTLPLA